MRPTAILFNNLLSMDVKEIIKDNPIDRVVVLRGVDKTTPGQLMGAASVDLPTIVVSSGPMLNGKFRGKDIGSGTDVWKFSEAVRAGEMTAKEFNQAETGMSRSRGTCMTMGSASSFAAIAEALCVTLPNNATIPAVDADRQRIAHLSGRRIVKLVEEDKRLSHYLTREAFENAIKVHAAIGGSTNSVIHLLALAGRIGLELTLADFDELAADVPLLVNLQPSGKYLMEDFHYAGGLPAVMAQMESILHTDIETIDGRVLKDTFAHADIFNKDVIRPLDNAIAPNSGVWILRGNICPNGALMKPSAASSNLITHRGKAVVFENIEDYKARIDTQSLDVDKDSILVLKGCGPVGYPGMPEVGNMALPQKLLEQGVKDMVRISDARMSGTAFGTVVLHVSPEADAGGPLAVVRSGDIISLDGPNRNLNVEISDEEIAIRMSELPNPPSIAPRGYAHLYQKTVQQADKGCDLDFLVGNSGAAVDRESH